MTVFKQYNDGTDTWDAIVVAEQGAQGLKGDPGDQGEAGIDGVGIPAGGVTGQVLTKASVVDYESEWESAENLPGILPSMAVFNTQTGTTYTLVFTDANKIVTLNNASAVTVTVPLNTSVGFLTGTRIKLVQLGAGAVTVDAAVGVVIYSTSLSLGAQYETGWLTKLSADTWLFEVDDDSGGGGGVSDGDKGDIVVSASGATWLFDSAVVTMAAKTVLDDATTGDMLTTLGAASTSDLSTHAADTTSVHGIADTSVLATTTDLSTHAADTTSVHGIADTSVLATTTAVALKVDKAQTINAQTGTTYTLVLTDDSKLVTLSNASAITCTVPLNSSVAFPTGTRVDLAQLGAGQVTVAATGGVTLNGTPGLKLRAQYSAATLVKLATDTWLLVGDLAA
jgi:hypothetical protein